MEYKELSKLYRIDTSSSRHTNLETEERLRRFADSTFLTGFKTPNGELFIAVPRELSVLSEKVLKSEQQVSAIIDMMSPLSANAVMRGLVLDEVVSTNAIEDIHSTRKQVKEALETTKGSPHARRFRELATLYLHIIDGNAQIPKRPEDIRVLYDKIMEGELSESQKPDGKIFRKEDVDITEGGVRILHSGLAPEEKIIDAMETMLKIAMSEELPSLYAAVASHYLFEYAHPFYDGNGRLGRYLLSLFLSKSLSVPTVLSLSRMILENRGSYYKAFRTTEDPLNRGELTFFVYSMLEMIRGAQVGIIEKLEDNKILQERLDISLDKAKAVFDLKQQETQIIYILLQYEAFGLLGDASVEEIAELLGLGQQMTRLHLRTLEEKGLVEKRRLRNPLMFALTPEFVKTYGPLA